MKDASPELIALLNNNNKFRTADLYTITLTNGNVLRYCDRDFNITVNGNTYKIFNIKRDGINQQQGLSIDNLSVDFYPKDSDLINGNYFIEAARIGVFDGALCQLDIAYFPTAWTDTPLILKKRFTGNIDISPDSDSIGLNYVKFEVKSPLELLKTVQFPQDIFQNTCDLLLYSSYCGVDKTKYLTTGVITSGSTLKVLNSNLISIPPGYFQGGTLTFTSGINDGVIAGVKLFSSGLITLSLPLNVLPVIGDSFSILPGCDKTMNTCKYRYDNLDNYGNCPFIPNPDNSYGM